MTRRGLATCRMWMALTTRSALVATAVTIPFTLAACRSCSRSNHVAEVVSHHGDIKRDTAATKNDWKPAPDGSEIAMGDALKTGPNSDAVIRLMRGGKIAMSSDTTLRFVANAKNPEGAGSLAIETGEASIEADDKGLAIETTIGVARIEPGGKLKVAAADGGGVRVEVTLGAARIDTEDGGVNLEPGRPMEVALGGAILEPGPSDLKDASAAADVSTPPPPSSGEIVINVTGAGVRVKPTGAATWQPRAAGAGALSPGDALEIPPGSSVDVRRGAEHGVLVGSGRFVIGGEGALVKASSGRVELEATTQDVSAEVPGGVVVAKGGAGKSRVDADLKPTETKVNVRQGQAEVRGKDTETVGAGESATLSPKGAVAMRGGKQPDRPDFTVRAGDSFMIRDPKPPTALGFDFTGMCPSGEGVVSRADGASARGDKRAALYLPAGHHEYAVRCIGPEGVVDPPVATGAITVVADAARAELARLPPATVVDMDGRRYTVLYQNLLPAVVARWQDAPTSSGYVLHVDKDKTKSSAAKQALRSGAIPEGTHAMWFETEDGAKRSAETTLVIKFDNAAPTASVREPVDGSFSAGESVKVAGVVVEGWSVTVNGAPVALDEQKRFSTTTTVPASESAIVSAIVLRITNPKRGTVYYVRHARSGGPR